MSLSFPDLSLSHNQLSEPSSPSALYVFIQFFSKKSPFIFVSYLLMPYFCIRFPRDGQHLILTCCNGVGSALQNNKNNFLFIWIIIIKVVIFAVRFAERGPLAVFFFPFRTERLGNKRRALRKKTSQNIWQFKINPLPLHPLLKRSRI